MDMDEEIVACLRRKRSAALATIIGSEGSTPLRAGARMLVGEGKTSVIGTVGGGLVEAEVQNVAARLLSSDAACTVRHFTLTEEQSNGDFLCGGSLDILIERLLPAYAGLYAALLSRRESGSDVAVATVIGSGPVVKGKFLISPDDAEPGTDDELRKLNAVAAGVPDTFREMVRDALKRKNVLRLPLPDGEIVVEPIVGVRDLLIFGGGHVSLYLSRSAALAGFRVTVIDDRPEFASKERFPEAHATLAVPFDAAWEQLRVNRSTSIAIVTRGHRYDEQVLERAVRTNAGYIGMIGSKRKVIATFEHLVSRGVPRDLLERVHAPIGLAIGAMTAEEIAISITAELIAVRRGVPSSFPAMSDQRSVEGVILAAGFSSRAGAFKPALPIGGKPMIRYCIDGMSAWCRRIFVVGGHEFGRLQALVSGIPGVECIENPDYNKGMFASVKAGLSRVSADRCFVLPADIPLVPPSVYRALLSVEASAVVPTFHGRNGHPVCLSRALIPRILEQADGSSLKEALQSIGFSTIEVEAEEILLDIDSPEDYSSVCRRIAAQQEP